MQMKPNIWQFTSEINIVINKYNEIFSIPRILYLTYNSLGLINQIIVYAYVH